MNAETAVGLLVTLVQGIVATVMAPVNFDPARAVIQEGLEYDPVVTTPFVAVSAFPVNGPTNPTAVMICAAKLPAPSLNTKVLGIFELETGRLPSITEN